MKNKFMISALSLTTGALIALTGCSNPPVSNEPTATQTQEVKPSPTKASPTTTKPSETKASNSPKPTASPTETATGKGNALTVLDTLTLSDNLLSGYKRTAFGSAWIDVDNNGCDTRNDILANQAVEITKNGSCDVTGGVFYDPYVLADVKYEGAGGGLDIDHVVALSAGWKTGGANWDETKRESFANDPLNLLAVNAGLNRYKGDKDASEWVPSFGKSKGVGSYNAEKDCPYVARQIAVKSKYGAFVTSSEKKAMKDVLALCPSENIPTGAISIKNAVKKAPTQSAPTQSAPIKEAPKKAPTDKKTETKTPKPSTNGKTDPDMGTCTKATAAGYGPYKKGTDPEYSFYQDRDGDGMVCE